MFTPTRNDVESIRDSLDVEPKQCLFPGCENGASAIDSYCPECKSKTRPKIASQL